MDRPFIVGKKIYLRPFELEDVNEQYLQWLNDAEVIRGRIERHFPLTRPEGEAYVQSCIENPNVILFAVIERETDRFIGSAKMGPINWFHRFTEHAIMIGDKTCWNKGYGGEIITLLLDYGFRWLNMHKIYAAISTANPASIKKNERIGYRTEAVFKEKVYFEGKYVDQVVMSFSEEEFFSLYPEPIMETDLSSPEKLEKTRAEQI